MIFGKGFPVSSSNCMPISSFNTSPHSLLPLQYTEYLLKYLELRFGFPFMRFLLPYTISWIRARVLKPNEKGGTIRKRRGKRKRKDGNWNEACGHTVRSLSVDLQDNELCRDTQSDDLVGIFNSVMENQYALVFRCQFDSQVFDYSVLILIPYFRFD
ncbi:hypothetical protein L2E82_19578 [Cichorium intybus]|uniref:Uncharacterized protein n=1 Tax=Cichorium intybus TaxID=13427 RepID=A0ACB9FDN4_CICIN|nr:hypothetical protein L2E82_19578 [Cichorium intybus]